MEKSTEELLNIMKNQKSYTDFFTDYVGELNFRSLSEYLTFLLEEKKLKKNDVISESNLDKNYAYQIFSGTKKNPSRDKLLMIAFGMRLSLNETCKLLKIAGLADLYVRDPRDSIIIYCLQKNKSLMETNIDLVNYGVDALE